MRLDRQADSIQVEGGGYAHRWCATSSGQLFSDIFGTKQRERAFTSHMATAAGHEVGRERRGGQNGVRAACSCGWATHWTSGPEASALANAHRKDAAVYGP
jgi:hypothetical protein